MKKILKIALVLMTLALFSTACSNVKGVSLVGTYKSGKNANDSMSVSSAGTVNFELSSSLSEAGDEISALYFLQRQGGQYVNLSLVPWDITSEKASYEYSVDYDFTYNNPSQGTSGTPIYTETDVQIKGSVNFKFTKDNEGVKCDVSYTFDSNPTVNMEGDYDYNTGRYNYVSKKLNNGSLTFTKN